MGRTVIFQRLLVSAMWTDAGPIPLVLMYQMLSGDSVGRESLSVRSVNWLLGGRCDVHRTYSDLFPLVVGEGTPATVAG